MRSYTFKPIKAEKSRESRVVTHRDMQTEDKEPPFSS